MVFIINSQGTTELVSTTPIHQGSSLVNEIVLLAPFASGNVVTVAFTLPFGEPTRPFLMENVDLTSLGITNGKSNYNAWVFKIKAPITEYAGFVKVQFFIYSGYNASNGTAGALLATATSQFQVMEGTFPELPETPDETTYDEMLNALSTIQTNTQDAVEKAISYVRYIAPDRYLLNSSIVSLSKTPSDIVLNALCDFTVKGMTKYLDEGNITSPAEGNNANELFFQNKTKTNPVGFIVDLGEQMQIGKVQIYAWNILANITVKLYLSDDNSIYTEADSITLPQTDSTVLDIFQLDGKSQSARFIKIVQDDTIWTDGVYSVKGVEIFAPNNEGKYIIKRVNGNVSYIDAVDADGLIAQTEAIKAEAIEQTESIKTEAIEQTEAIKTEAQGSATVANDAKLYVEEYLKKANTAGGALLLEDIGGKPKIPSIYIQQVDIKDYIQITNESELDTVEAQKGDVALLVENIDGTKTVTKSWILLEIAEDGTRTWAVYGTSYATNAGNATFATDAGNALTVGENKLAINGIFTEEAYNQVQDKSGVYFVSI